MADADATSSQAEPTASQRRKSGRAVRAPEKFAPEPKSSQAPRGGGKRKRAENDNEKLNGEEQEEEAEEDEEDEEEPETESEVEDAPKKKKAKMKGPTKKTPASRKAKTNGVASQAPREPREPKQQQMRIPSRPKKAQHGKVVFKDNGAEGIYAEIFTSGKTTDEAATYWLSKYEEASPEATTDLINCVLKCAGCDIKVTEDDINDPDNIAGRLEDIQEAHKDHTTADYPLVAKAKAANAVAFKHTLTGFFESLIKVMRETGLLYNDVALIENIIAWVTTMSSSSLRPFRHTATVIALACTTGLCVAVKDHMDATAATTKLLEKENNAKKPNKARITAFEKKIDEGKQHRQMSEDTIQEFWDTVFVHRYRDLDPRIRNDCMEALGGWIIILPSKFYDGTSLRYLGWELSDLVGHVRNEVLDQLKRIVKRMDIGGISTFIERFRPRIIEMATLDAESVVRAAAVDLLDSIREKGMLEPDDIDVIGKLIFDSDARVRKAVVNFFAATIEDLYESKIEELGGEEALEDVFSLDDENKSNPNAGWIKLKALGESLLNYDNETADDDDEAQENIKKHIQDGQIIAAGFESRYSLAAEALYDKMEELRDWEMLAGYLLFDHSNRHKHGSVPVSVQDAFKLEDKEEVVLLEILHAVVKITMERLGEDKQGKKKARAASKDDEDKVARTLASLLPKLLKRFGSNPKTSTAVLRLVQILNLGVFQELRQDNTEYAALLHEIQSQFKSHADTRVLKEASVAMLHAQGFEDLEETTGDHISSSWDETIEDLRKRFPQSEAETVRGDTKIDRLVPLTTTMTRLRHLCSISNPVEHLEKVPAKPRAAVRATGMSAIDMIIELAGRGYLQTPDNELDDYEDRLVIAADKAALLYFMWKCEFIKETLAKNEFLTDSWVEEVKTRMQAFINALTLTISSRAGHDPCRLEATGCLLDLYVVFHTVLASKKGTHEELDGWEEAMELVKMMDDEVVKEITTIYATAEQNYAKKAGKTLGPPADDDEPEELDSDEEDEDVELAQRQAEALKAEHQLCELGSHVVLALCAGVIVEDAEKPRLRGRLLRNRKKLGANMDRILAALDMRSNAKAEKAKREKQKQRYQQPMEKEDAISKERVEDSDEEEEHEEVDAEAARDKELLEDEEGPQSVHEEEQQDVEEEDVEMLGD